MFFLQGYNAARDRLWQIDLWRKRGLGLLAKDFGPGYVAQDRAARLFLYRGDLSREWAAYGPDAKASAEAFAAGIDAFVGEINSGLRSPPIEFRVAGTKPDLWKAEDIVRIRSHALTRNVTSEVQRARVACAAGVAADRLRSKLEPEWTPQVPAGTRSVHDSEGRFAELLPRYDDRRHVLTPSPATQRNLRLLPMSYDQIRPFKCAHCGFGLSRFG